MIQQKNLQKRRKKTLTTLIQFKKLSYLYHRFLSSSSMLINRHTGIFVYFLHQESGNKNCVSTCEGDVQKTHRDW